MDCVAKIVTGFVLSPPKLNRVLGNELTSVNRTVLQRRPLT